ncbi:carcinoembryonic antigen-related cell adhesion molecule 5-like isoform X2 [Hydractinia symbiolongicarpus]|uniref:carcinoembryonic antigen-related cell adhesion molecule 5-like isoform X2 n=1 Tax=Hydractinia symbiolongicarpus TaxID=13093 RepID=UPI00254E2EF6|nr:carcinoembryonic antigen-related cell adhesion molecule 5-like isoform X2 [Hydractinia symbiolongicarpus]
MIKFSEMLGIFIVVMFSQMAWSEVPRIEFVAGGKTMKEGERLEMLCNSTHNASYSIHWSFNNTARHETVTRERIVIPAVNITDSGDYFCGRYNKTDGKFLAMSEVVTINVQSLPEVPKIVFIAGSEKMKEGERLEMMCNSTHNTFYSIHWSFNNTARHETLTTKRIVIPAVNRTDSGDYFCGRFKTDGKFLAKSNVVNVKVRYMDTPVLKITPSTVTEEGNQITMVCDVADAMPAVTRYSFVKSAERYLTQSTDSSTHVVTLATANDTGYYYCSAHNSIKEKRSKEVFLTVTEVLSVPVVEFSSNTPLIGQQLTIKCAVNFSHADKSSNPVQYTWYKDKSMMKLRHSRFTKSKLATSDLGEYVCTAGINRSHTVYTKTSKPAQLNGSIEVKVNSISQEERTAARLKCDTTTDVSDEYVEHSWKKDGKDLDEYKNISIIPWKADSFLRNIAGIYVCEVRISGKVNGRSNRAKVNVKYNDRPKLMNVGKYRGDSSRNVVHCNTSSNPTPEITFYENGRVVKRGKENEYVVQLLQTEKKKYSCGAKNGVNNNNVEMSNSITFQAHTAEREDSNNKPTIIGACIGMLVLAFLIILVVYKIYKTKKTKPQTMEEPIYETADRVVFQQIPESPPQNIYVSAKKEVPQAVYRRNSLKDSLEVELPKLGAQKDIDAKSVGSESPYGWVKFESDNPYDKVTFESEN